MQGVGRKGVETGGGVKRVKVPSSTAAFSFHPVSLQVGQVLVSRGGAYSLPGVLFLKFSMVTESTFWMMTYLLDLADETRRYLD